MRKSYLGQCLVFSLIFLSACSSTQNRSVDLKRAATLNAEMGNRYMAQGDLESAVKKFEKALRQDPSLPDAHAGYGLLMSQLGESAKAKKHFKKALKKDPYNSDFLNNYGVFLYREGDVEEAEKRFLAALKDPLYKTPEFAYTNAGRCRVKQGDDITAESYFNKALSANPRFPDALLQIAKVYQRRGKFQLAYAYMQKYEQYGTQTADTLWMLSGLANRMGDKNKAASYQLLLRNKFPESEQAAQLRGMGR